VDYYIPSANGPAVIRYLTQKNTAAHVALVSSSDKASNQEEAKAAGAEACICTSFAEEVVEKSILELLELWKAA
jgi:DNA-binding NarL/FixJ family response regulator